MSDSTSLVWVYVDQNCTAIYSQHLPVAPAICAQFGWQTIDSKAEQAFKLSFWSSAGVPNICCSGTMAIMSPVIWQTQLVVVLCSCRFCRESAQHRLGAVKPYLPVAHPLLPVAPLGAVCRTKAWWIKQKTLQAQLVRTAPSFTLRTL